MRKAPRPADDPVAEQIVAEAILEHLLLCGWQLGRPPPSGPSPSR